MTGLFFEELAVNVFKARSLNIIDDLSINERKWFFQKVYELKKAIIEDDKEAMDSFRINDPDFGIYEVFLEDSTRTKESFRNAAKFHHAKVSELLTSASSINKGESYADTFNMLTGYSNSIFIVRSRVEGLTKWLSEECQSYAERNNLPYRSAFINAGDGKHEHPTQELLDEFSFLEDLDMSFDYIHVALVGDLYHGRTVHSKADGLRIFSRVKVDLVAPPLLMMPENYIEKMRENGYEVSIYDSIEQYVKTAKPAKLWYFTRPQLERMGERVLQVQETLRSAITFRKEFIPYIDPDSKFYHPLPRHKEHPTIPTWLDDTSFNAWERQAINGMYCRIVLLSMIAGKIGDDYVPQPEDAHEDLETEEYIIEAEPKHTHKAAKYSEGVRPIANGIVIDHICKGDTPGEIRDHMRLISSVLDLDDGRGGEWVSRGSDGQCKGIIFRPEARTFERKDLKRLAAVAPHCTLNIVKDGSIVEKYRTHLPPRIYNFDDLCCTNEACISNPANGEGTPAEFHRTKDGHFECKYCGCFHTFKEIWRKH